MKTIILKQKDIEKAGIQNSESGMLIDELAYSAKQWTSEELYSNNMDYEPNEPYSFNYEADLFENTKTGEQLYSIAQKLKVSINANWSRISDEQKLQAGACVALNNSDEWEALLNAYTEALKEERTEGISSKYNQALEKELEDYHDEQYRSWLSGDRDYRGVIREVASYFFDEAKGTYNTKEHEYIFEVDEQELHNTYCGADLSDSADECEECKKIDFKACLLDSIKESSNARKAKDETERQKRIAEYEKKKQYKKERAEKEAEERKVKLLSMKQDK